MPARREPTLADVAERAGVSLTTVSRVLNNRGYLSQYTRDRVALAIKELGYRPNQVARALHGMSTNTVGVIMPTTSLPFFGELVAGLESTLAEAGYRTLLCNSMGRVDREREYLDLLIAQRVDGIISGAHNEMQMDYDTVRMPLVTIDRDLSSTIPNIRADNLAGGRLATEHLLARGRTRPAILTSRTGPHNLREAGYRAVLAEHSIQPVLLTVEFHTPDSMRYGLVSSQLDAVAQEIDSVFATDDLAAAAVLEWAYQHGRRVPEDFAVVGFDGTSAVRRALPGLTTIQQPIAQIARAAVSQLLEQVRAYADGQEVRTKPTRATELPITLLEGRTA